jgi:uncharacterized membrane protein HdeD (DUF308 family)
MTGIAGIRSAAGVEGRAKTFAIVAGAVSILFGVIVAVALLLVPGATVLSLIWVVGVYAVVFGVMLIISAIHARSAGRKLVTAAD